MRNFSSQWAAMRNALDLNLCRLTGVIMTDLQGALSGQTFSDFLWEFHLAPDAHLSGAVFEDSDANEGEDESSRDEASPSRHPELPTHTFRKGDPVLLLQALPDGSLPSPVKL